MKIKIISGNNNVFCWEGVGWVLIPGWALDNFLGFQGGCLFKVGAYSKVGG